MQKITLSDRSWLKPLLESQEPTISEYSFGNLFLFQSTHWYEWFELDGKRYIKGLSYTSEWFLLPLFKIQNTDELKRALDHAHASYLYPIDDVSKTFFSDKEWRFESLLSESDYLYSTETIRTYPGRAFDGRRNLVHQFEGTHTVESKPLLPDDALIVLDGWYHQMQTAEMEVSACKLALKHWSELSLFGRTTYADQKPVGIAIGEHLNNKTVVLHFAKALGPEKGVYQYLYQDFARSIPDTYIYLNWEQDLGVAGLRQAKEAYKPISHITKWRIFSK